MLLGLLIDALILMALLKLIIDEEGSLLAAGVLALGTSIVINGIVFALAPALGILALPIAVILPGIILGVCISAIYGAEIKRAFLIAGLFIGIRLAYGIALALMFGGE